MTASQDLASAAAQARLRELSEALRGEQETNLLLQESLAELELATEDLGWQRTTAEGQIEFSDGGLRRIVALCQLMALKNPLIKRGLALRSAYVWGQGLSITAPAAGDGGQDVNAVVQAFLDDEANQVEFSGVDAQITLDHAADTDGNVFFALFTRPMTGRVTVRTVPFMEITDRICDPQDRADVWFYRREYTAGDVIDPATGRTSAQAVTVYYPALGSYPRRPRVPYIDGREVRWDAPMLHHAEGRPQGWRWGVPPVYAAIDWARAYKDYLGDWATLMRALSRFAFRTSGPGRKQAAARAELAAAPTLDPYTGEPRRVAGTVQLGSDQTFEAIPKTGATIDAESGRPLAVMVAAALDLPVTMLLGDPGLTGARATAETLDRPTELAMQLRQARWGQTIRRVLNHVIDAAVKAPKGPLQGRVTRDDDGREVVELADEDDRTIVIAWPDLDEVDVTASVAAIVNADATGKVPPLVVARLLLQVLGVGDIDEVLAEITDADGNWIDPAVSAGAAAAAAYRAGADPAVILGGEPDVGPGPGPVGD